MSPPPAGNTASTAKAAQDSPEAVKKGLSAGAKPSFVVMHVDQRLSVSPPEPVNAFRALRIVEGPRGERCARCVAHIFVDRTDGQWNVKSIPVGGADVC